MADAAAQRPTRRRFAWAVLTSLLVHAALGGLLYWKGQIPQPVARAVTLSITLAAPTATTVSLPPDPPSAAKAQPPPPTTELAPSAAQAPSPKPATARPRAIARPVHPSPAPGTAGHPDAAPPAQTPAITAPPEPSPPPPPQSIPSDYANLVFERIARLARRNYPQAAILRHQEGKVGYHLVLSSTGELLDHRIDPSGIASLDRAAEQAVMTAAPFPQPPDMNATTFRLSGTIIYRLEN